MNAVWLVEYRVGDSGWVEGVYASAAAAHAARDAKPPKHRPNYIVTEYPVRHLVPEYGHTVR